MNIFFQFTISQTVYPPQDREGYKNTGPEKNREGKYQITNTIPSDSTQHLCFTQYMHERHCQNRRPYNHYNEEYRERDKKLERRFFIIFQCIIFQRKHPCFLNERKYKSRAETELSPLFSSYFFHNEPHNCASINPHI
ncbi:hypothetical protein BH14560 [Bartonella henselae str. Houston-1]|uniref:Uncharacterized protein n=1 Tax=Bartonella henselae (strain ATCC 49882 / DSM 28221 / CCUG 30454 / Houston 1) TaxID=283166 RepID=A0A0H3M470_BARHE|nr:hypothetical protein BH14560 [Bartonella henselae str. Houston-1]